MKRLAIDLGASSGRHIVGWTENGKTVTEEVYRFPNGAKKIGGCLCWDVENLFAEVKRGLKLALERYDDIESVAVDSWGVDYVLMRDGNPVLPCFSYRDGRTERSFPLAAAVTPQSFLYPRTGVQAQYINTIYQLYDDKINGRLEGVTSFLMIPEYVNYRLTGRMMKEYTNATTTGLVNVFSRSFDKEIIEKLGYPAEIFTELHSAGETVGPLLPEIEKEVGGQLTVKLCASHDTASAFEAVDNEENSVLISSGTWSLIGIKLREANVAKEAEEMNFTNEGGVGYVRFLKNQTGLWLDVRLREEFGLSYAEVASAAAGSTFDEVFDVDDRAFIAPEKMSEAITAWLNERGKSTPATCGDFFNSAYRSMANGYRKTIEQIEKIIGTEVKKIYVVGGGAKNALLTRYTEEYTGKQVVAIPIEATALGNLSSQARGE